MSLYDDIIEDRLKADKEKSGWSSTSGRNMLQDHLSLKKQTQQQNKQNVKKPLMTHKKVYEGVHDEQAPPPAIGSAGSSLHSKGLLLGGDWDMSKEYDPLWPNDYEKIMSERRFIRNKEKEKARMKELEEREKRRMEKLSQNANTIVATGSLGLDYGDDSEDEDEDEDEMKNGRPSGGAMIAPPPSLTVSSEPTISDRTKPAFGNIGNVSSVAQKIMARMGYKEGQGLGKEEQGMSKPLQVEGTMSGHGKIKHEKDVTKTSSMPPPSMPPPILPVSSLSSPSLSSTPPSQSLVTPTVDASGQSITEIMKNPSKIVLLRNMVGPGEVDDDLEQETKEECGKYGEVIRCLIFEIKGENIHEDEAVRIFIEFKRVESAIKAVVDLNGRYFGGRIVKGTFYDPEKFKKYELRD